MQIVSDVDKVLIHEKELHQFSIHGGSPQSEEQVVEKAIIKALGFRSFVQLLCSEAFPVTFRCSTQELGTYLSLHLPVQLSLRGAHFYELKV